MSISFRNFQSGGVLSSHIVPGAYSHFTTTQGSSGSVRANVGVIMGQSSQGLPATLLQFNSVSDAESALGSGELFDAVRMAFNPSPDYTPQSIYAMRVNSATQSTLALKNGTAQTMITLTSSDYGLVTQQVNLTIAAGTTVGQKLTFGFKTNSQVFDNVYRSSITITHASATAAVTLNSTTHTLVLSGGPVTIDLSLYSTLSQLAAYINTITGYSAVVTAGQASASSLLLDSITATSLVGGLVLTSNMQAIIDVINNTCLYATAVAANGVNNRGAIAATLATTYFASGTDGTYTATEWTAALLALESENVNFISTPNVSSSVWAAISSHVTTMCSPTKKKERQFIVGNDWGTSDSQRVTDATTLNNQYGMYVTQGFKQYDVNGIVQQYGAGYAGCLLMGMACASAINMPLTSKTLNVISLEAKLSQTRMENLLTNGCCVLNYDANGIPKVVRQLNSYQTDNLILNEWSSVREINFVSLDLRNYLQSLYIGQPGSSFSGTGVVTGAVISRLKQYEAAGIFTQNDAGISFWNVAAVLNGDTITIDYDAYITLPVNFVFMTQHFHDLVQAVS